MNTKGKAQLKDKVLKAVNTEGANDPSEIAEANNVDNKLVRYLCEELREEGFIMLIEVINLHSGPTKDYLLQPTNKGIYFLSIDGGFIKNYNSGQWNKRWVIVKTIAAAVNAIIIVLIGFYSLYLTNKTTQLERENEELKKTVNIQSPAQVDDR